MKPSANQIQIHFIHRILMKLLFPSTQRDFPGFSGRKRLTLPETLLCDRKSVLFQSKSSLTLTIKQKPSSV